MKLAVGHSDLLKPIKTDFAVEAIWDDHWLALTQFVLVSKLDLLFPPFSVASSNYFRVSCFRFIKSHMSFLTRSLSVYFFGNLFGTIPFYLIFFYSEFFGTPQVK